MKRKSISDLAKEHGWVISTHKIDKEFEFELLTFLRSSKTPQATQDIATHFSKELREVEYYLGRLEEQRLAQYISAGARRWGWVGVELQKN